MAPGHVLGCGSCGVPEGDLVLELGSGGFVCVTCVAASVRAALASAPASSRGRTPAAEDSMDRARFPKFSKACVHGMPPVAIPALARRIQAEVEAKEGDEVAQLAALCRISGKDPEAAADDGVRCHFLEKALLATAEGSAAAAATYTRACAFFVHLKEHGSPFISAMTGKPAPGPAAPSQKDAEDAALKYRMFSSTLRLAHGRGGMGVAFLRDLVPCACLVGPRGEDKRLRDLLFKVPAATHVINVDSDEMALIDAMSAGAVGATAVARCLVAAPAPPPPAPRQGPPRRPRYPRFRLTCRHGAAAVDRDFDLVASRMAGLVKQADRNAPREVLQLQAIFQRFPVEAMDPRTPRTLVRYVVYSLACVDPNFDEQVGCAAMRALLYIEFVQAHGPYAGASQAAKEELRRTLPRHYDLANVTAEAKRRVNCRCLN